MCSRANASSLRNHSKTIDGGVHQEDSSTRDVLSKYLHSILVFQILTLYTDKLCFLLIVFSLIRIFRLLIHMILPQQLSFVDQLILVVSILCDSKFETLSVSKVFMLYFVQEWGQNQNYLHPSYIQIFWTFRPY